MTRIKICGLTRAEDAAAAYRLGAWALGFVFYPKSPRAIGADAVRAILKSLPGDAKGVGVFVNASIEEIGRAVAAAGLRGVQLHGDESPEFARTLRERLPSGVELFKALRLASVDEIPIVENYGFCDAIVVESAAAAGHFGGSGISGDWRIAALAARRAKVILAGGLRPENVIAAVEAVRPLAVDVSSGIEVSPRVKSIAAMNSFFDGVQNAAR